MGLRALSVAAIVLSALLGGRAALAEATAPSDMPMAPEKGSGPQTPAQVRADLYSRLAAATDPNETNGIIDLLLASYAQSGSDTGDLDRKSTRLNSSHANISYAVF